MNTTTLFASIKGERTHVEAVAYWEQKSMRWVAQTPGYMGATFTDFRIYRAED